MNTRTRLAVLTLVLVAACESQEEEQARRKQRRALFLAEQLEAQEACIRACKASGGNFRTLESHSWPATHWQCHCNPPCVPEAGR